ncbi:MAG TPA: type II toxin-antitoxin system ParD family antitoxin [Phycisphaerae bacterium]|nr:type II toxin-antitoxin system ParD family antitoxin [Phycisphaerae bacterium]
MRSSLNISLTPELQRFVNKRVASGRYQSASEVVRDALRLLEDREHSRAAQLSEFQLELNRRLASLDRGEYAESSVVRSNLRRKSDRRRKLRI